MVEPAASSRTIVVGSGPNGLAAAITMARAGRSVLVLEAEEVAGGGARSAELTLPGFVHDLCSAIYPLGVGSPFFRPLPTAEHGLAWSFPAAAVTHPFDDGTAIVLERSVEETGKQLGRDAAAYQRLMSPLVAACDALMLELLRPLRPPRHPIRAAARPVLDPGPRSLHLFLLHAARRRCPWHVRLPCSASGSARRSETSSLTGSFLEP
jgi:phytoene dehydrogenase-like protein